MRHARRLGPGQAAKGERMIGREPYVEARHACYIDNSGFGTWQAWLNAT